MQKIEEQLRIRRRWLPTDAPFKHAQYELKVHHVQKLQVSVEKLAGAVNLYSSALERRNSNARSRHDVTSLTRTRAKKKDALRRAIQELKSWHRFPHERLLPVALQYDAESLDADAVCDLGFPWVAKEWLVPDVCLQQQLCFRAIEEKEIIKREANDAKEFYGHFVKQCRDMSLQLQAQVEQAATGQLQPLLHKCFLPRAVHYSFTHSSQSKLVQQFLKGELSMLSKKESWYQARLDEMESLIEGLAAPAMAAPESGAEDDVSLLEVLHEAAIYAMNVQEDEE